ncbi:hypothetical protein TIFTF001_029332 [Ficus carica]|uniref:Uncharacterized protein n=1 Tax=Ficus carica TaxID=3494 RepID=A0AA88DRK2_FICCA|nr:hypothetical protein TIFTF001_029332 [Ficus carica]
MEAVVHKECNHLRHEGLCNKELYYNVFVKKSCCRHLGIRGGNRRAGDDAGSSRSRGSSGKRKQREATDELTYSAMQEIVSHFRSRLQSGTSNHQSSQPDPLLTCMNIMTKMGILLNQRTVMWHYFEAHPRVQHTFH